MPNFLHDIEAALEGEVVDGIVIGEMGWGDYNSDKVARYAEIPKGRLIPWEEARPFLDFDYNDGYGAPECPAVYLWTPARVLFISTYDGSTSVVTVPRHPIDCMPEMPGGG